MPLPLILGIAAAIAGATGVGLGIKGAVDMADANDTLNKAKKRDEENLKRHKSTETRTLRMMDELGSEEINALKNLEAFSQLFEKIHNKPKFEKILGTNVKITPFTPNELNNASVGAAVLAGGLGGAALGTAGGFAAASATTAAVMALGTASTGTAISTLSGVAATNATLAALGGGSLAAGGGGMALGTTILGASTLGVGLLVGGIIFSLSGSSISDKADKAHRQMLENEKKVNTICKFMDELNKTASMYLSIFREVVVMYNNYLSKMRSIIEIKHKINPNWNDFAIEEKKTIENTVLLVGVIYNMCKVKLVLSDGGKDVNKVNYKDINKATTMANDTMSSVNV